MKSIVEYIEQLRIKYNLNSYYAAMNFLKMSRQSWTKIKNGGGISDKNSIRLAEALKIDPMEIIAVSRSLSAENRESKNIWIKLAKEKENQRLNQH